MLFSAIVALTSLSLIAQTPLHYLLSLLRHQDTMMDYQLQHSVHGGQKQLTQEKEPGVRSLLTVAHTPISSYSQVP
jgi:hypothetical protein